ncbi:hypothetical protein [Streptomyces erythrochromogenes]|uniref:hypothetical protein n=1 Tax=Streptomyces erythrochromogenes TaxID=285574 RepID=UPI0036C3C33A
MVMWFHVGVSRSAWTSSEVQAVHEAATIGVVTRTLVFGWVAGVGARAAAMSSSYPPIGSANTMNPDSAGRRSMLTRSRGGVAAAARASAVMSAVAK